MSKYRPVIHWLPTQGARCLSLKGSWDWLQPPYNPDGNAVHKIDRCMDNPSISCFAIAYSKLHKLLRIQKQVVKVAITAKWMGGLRALLIKLLCIRWRQWLLSNQTHCKWIAWQKQHKDRWNDSQKLCSLKLKISNLIQVLLCWLDRPPIHHYNTQYT